MKKLKWLFGHIPELITGAAFCVMILVVFVNVLLRYIASKSLVWCEEVAALGFIWTIFVGAAVCYKHRGLISVDLLIAALPACAKRAMTIALDVFLLLASLLFCYLSLQFSLSAWDKTSLSLKIPYTFFDIASTVGFAFMSYYSVKHLIGDIRGEGVETSVDTL